MRKAEKTFRHALKVTPESPDLHNILGTVFWAQDKHTDAKKIQKAMELSLGYGLEFHNQAEDKESQNF